ncbi:transposase [Streptomyces sp. NPDC014986]|uniref:transposase n=1 Tax=Streptomyces sp. NPDC014986 TaxID=3364934 RepID=UPI0036F5E3E3
MHVLSDANGLPLLVGVSAGNTHDSEGLKPMVEGHQTRHDPHRGRYFKPQRLHADKAYDRADLRKWLRGKRIGVRIERKGIESGERSGRRRGSSSAPCRGCPATADSAPATSTIPATTWPSSASPPPSAATNDFSASPHRTRSKARTRWRRDSPPASPALPVRAPGHQHLTTE